MLYPGCCPDRGWNGATDDDAMGAVLVREPGPTGPSDWLRSAAAMDARADELSKRLTTWAAYVQPGPYRDDALASVSNLRASAAELRLRARPVPSLMAAE